MNDFLKKYKAFIIVFALLLPIFVYLDYVKIILIPDDEPLEVLIVFCIWWILISLPFYNLDYLKRNRVVVYKVLGLIALLITTLAADSWINIPDNPISIFLIITFWLGVFYVIFPSFFQKYLYYIIGVYALAFGYWTYVRLFSSSFETYLEHEKGLAFSLLILPIPLFAVMWGYEQWKWLKSLKADKSKAELELLKTQINPHFFFNTLNNLYSLTVKHSDEAPGVILKLSDMMRYTIYEGKNELVSLKNEIDYLNNYIELHKIRYHKIVDIQFHCNVDENVKVAPLLFIILLENAFKHGIESLSNSAYVSMNLTSIDNSVHFALENNFDPKEIGEEKGIGLENLKRRLDLIYPKKHELTMHEVEGVFKVDLKLNTL